jgi:hypothetical protein
MTKELLRVAAGTDFGKIFFHLFNEQNGIINTDLYFDGLNTIKFHSITILITNKITGYGTTSEQAPVTGDGTFNDEWTVVKGKVTGSAKLEPYEIIAGPNLPPQIPFTNIFRPFTNRIIFTNVFRITNEPPPRFHPPTNPPSAIILLNPQAKTQTPAGSVITLR